MRETAKLKLGGMRAPGSPALVLPAVSKVAEEETGSLGPRAEAPEGRRANSQAGGGCSPGTGGLRARNRDFSTYSGPLNTVLSSVCLHFSSTGHIPSFGCKSYGSS